MGEELADDAEAGQVRVQRALVEGDVWAEHGPHVVVQIWDVDVVAGRAHDRIDGLDRAVDEGDGTAVDRSDRRTAEDAAVRDLREVVLTQRKSRGEDVAVRLGRSECGGVADDAQDPVAERAAQRLAREQAPLERPKRGVPLPVRRHPVDDLLDHVAGLAEGRDHGRDGREIGCDFEAADPVAVDERTAIAIERGAGILEGVEDVAVERVKPGRQARLAEAAPGHDHAVEALTVDRPGGKDPADRRAQPDPIGDAEVLRVGAQIGVDLLGGGVKRMVGRGGEVRERGHRAARVRMHSRPHSAMGGSRVPLATEVIARLEDRHVKARL